jgi:hypothetical protein
MVGVIIAVYPLAMMLSAPLWSYLTPYAGRMYIYCAGVLTLALGMLGFTLALAKRGLGLFIIYEHDVLNEPSPQFFTGIRDERVFRNFNSLA